MLICNHVPRLTVLSFVSIFFNYLLSRRNDTNLFLVGEMRVGEMRVGEMRVGEMRVGEMRVGKMSVGEMRE